MKSGAFLILSYLLGSIPFGLVISYLVKGIDIRKYGSGNIGATNVVRVVGKGWGILVFILDFFKGLTPLLLAKIIIAPSNLIYVILALASVCGHNWPLFLKFKGGKGVATSLGALCALAVIFPKLWLVLAISLGVWVLAFYLSRYVSLASILLGLSFFLFSFILSLPKEIKAFSFLIFVFILIRHNKNIKNLFARKEHRF
jgi:glycerol-3-phosphate acyltransferase PlsY